MVIYDPAQAKAGVLEIFENLKALNAKLTEALEDKDDAVTAESFQSFFTQYEQFPITWQIDWAAAGLTPEEGQEVADAVRSQLQQMTGAIGLNKHIPRLFQGAPSSA